MHRYSHFEDPGVSFNGCFMPLEGGSQGGFVYTIASGGIEFSVCPHKRRKDGRPHLSARLIHIWRSHGASIGVYTDGDYRDPVYHVRSVSTKGVIQEHHNHKTNKQGMSGKFGMAFMILAFRNNFMAYHKKHCSGSKSHGKWKNGLCNLYKSRA